jgi:hypothetical protein
VLGRETFGERIKGVLETVGEGMPGDPGREVTGEAPGDAENGTRTERGARIIGVGARRIAVGAEVSARFGTGRGEGASGSRFASLDEMPARLVIGAGGDAAALRLNGQRSESASSLSASAAPASNL